MQPEGSTPSGVAGGGVDAPDVCHGWPCHPQGWMEEVLMTKILAYMDQAQQDPFTIYYAPYSIHA